MPTEIAGITTCKLCGEKIIGSALLITPGTATTAQAGRLAALVQKLVDHLTAKHPRILGGIEIAKAEFGGLALMLNYTTTDQSFQAQRDWLRWRVHQQTLNARISDEGITAKTAELTEKILANIPAEPEVEREVTRREITQLLREAITELRDALQEPNEPPNVLAGGRPTH